MRRSFLALFLLAVLGLPLARVHAAAEPAGFAGIWTGEITAPDQRAEFGLAFTATEKGFLVSLNFPAMFLHSVNFGPAAIDGDTFTLAPLNLTLTRDGDTLTGTFALSKLPVTLHRGGDFTPAPTPTAFPAAPAPAWTRPLGAPAWAPVATRDAIVYVGTTDGVMHALRATDGAEAWRWTGPSPIYGEALPTADALYFVDDSGHLTALDRGDGSLRWRTPLHDAKLAGGPRPANETFNHRAVAPVIDAKGALLYVGSTDGGVYAVRARNGRVLWRADLKTRVYAPVALRGREVIAAGFDGAVVTLDARNGRELARTRVGGPVVSAPVVAGARVIVGARDYLLYGLDAKGAVAWRDSYWFSWVESTPRLVDGTLYIGGSDYRRISALDPATGRAHWSTDVRGLSWGSPVVTADTVYAGTAGQNIEGTVIQHTGGLVALDRATGAVRWRYLAPVPTGADFTGFAGSLILADGKIIGATVDGTLVALPAAP